MIDRDALLADLDPLEISDRTRTRKFRRRKVLSGLVLEISAAENLQIEPELKILTLEKASRTRSRDFRR